MVELDEEKGKKDGADSEAFVVPVVMLLRGLFSLFLHFTPDLGEEGFEQKLAVLGALVIFGLLRDLVVHLFSIDVIKLEGIEEFLLELRAVHVHHGIHFLLHLLELVLESVLVVLRSPLFQVTTLMVWRMHRARDRSVVLKNLGDPHDLAARVLGGSPGQKEHDQTDETVSEGAFSHPFTLAAGRALGEADVAESH